MLRVLWCRSFLYSVRVDSSSLLFHSTVLQDIDRKEHSIKQHRGKVVLVVNVASQCGLHSSIQSAPTAARIMHSCFSGALITP